MFWGEEALAGRSGFYSRFMPSRAWSSLRFHVLLGSIPHLSIETLVAHLSGPYTVAKPRSALFSVANLHVSSTPFGRGLSTGPLGLEVVRVVITSGDWGSADQRSTESAQNV